MEPLTSLTASMLGTEIVRDQRGRIVDMYSLAAGSPASSALPQYVLRALAAQSRPAEPTLN